MCIYIYCIIYVYIGLNYNDKIRDVTSKGGLGMWNPPKICAISGKFEVNEIQMFPDLYIHVETPMFLFNERNFSCCEHSHQARVQFLEVEPTVGFDGIFSVHRPFVRLFWIVFVWGKTSMFMNGFLGQKKEKVPLLEF